MFLPWQSDSTQNALLNPSTQGVFAESSSLKALPRAEVVTTHNLSVQNIIHLTQSQTQMCDLSMVPSNLINTSITDGYVTSG